MKYDLSVAVPVTDSTKQLFKRYENLKRYGFLNIGDRKLQVKLLVCPDEDFYGNDITKGWPDGVDVVRVETPYADVSRKIVWFFATLSESDISEARWHAKFDDDAVNDIDRMVCRLDEDFDWHRPEYLVTEHRYEIEERECLSLKNIGCEHLCRLNRIGHEWEANICSQSAMSLYRNNEKSMEYLNERLKHPDGFGDQCIGIALHFCKIHPVVSGFMSYWTRLDDFSLFGGSLSHVHLQLERFNETRPLALLKAVVDNITNDSTKALVYEAPYGFSREDNFSPNGDIVFHKDHRIVNIDGFPIGIWSANKEGGLIIVFGSMPWHGWDVAYKEQTGVFEGFCPDSKLPTKMALIS